MLTICCYYPHLTQVCKTISIEFLTSVKSGALKSIQIYQKLWYFQKEEEKLKTALNLKKKKETEVETVSHYKYLGVNISHTGTFIVAEKNLSLKASRA